MKSIKQIHAPVPAEVHKAFKRMTVNMNTTMTAVVEELVSKWLQEKTARSHQIDLDDVVRDWINMRTAPF